MNDDDRKAAISQIGHANEEYYQALDAIANKYPGITGAEWYSLVEDTAGTDEGYWDWILEVWEPLPEEPTSSGSHPVGER